MGRRKGPHKDTVTIRLTPKAQEYVVDLLQYARATRGWNNHKVYTKSLMIEQSIGHYWKSQKAMHETEGKYCGCCGHPTDLSMRSEVPQDGTKT
jgi:hypothetical protein